MKYTHLLITVFTIILALNSCMVGPDFQKVKIESPNKYRLAEEPTDTIINLKWWELFQDTTLITLIDSGLKYNNDVRIAASRIEESRIYLGYTKADMYPNFSYGGNFSYGNSLGGIAPTGNVEAGFSTTANMSWEIDFWGKYRRSNEAARAELLASEYGLRTIQISLITEISNAYHTLLDYKYRLEIGKRTLESRNESLRIIQERFDNGIIPEIDLNQSQIQNAIAARTIPAAERAVAYAENALKVLTGQNPDRVQIYSTIVDQIVPPTIPVGIPSQLLTRRPDIMIAEQKVVAQNARIGVAQAMRFPSISLTAMFGMASTSLASFNAGDALMGTVGAGLFGPIFNFGKNKRRVEIEAERTKQVKINYEETVLQAFRETEDALINISTLERELESVDLQLTASKNASRLSNVRYNGGVASYLEVVDTDRTLFEIELYHSELLQRRLAAYTNLYKTLGGGWIDKEN